MHCRPIARSRWALLHAAAASTLLAAPAAAQMRTACFEGRKYTCVAVEVATTPTPTGTSVTVRLANLQGKSLDVPAHVDWARFHGIELLGAGPTFAGSWIDTADPTVQVDGGAVDVGDTRERWFSFNVGDDTVPQHGYALETPYQERGADILGCTVPVDEGYPYFTTCNASAPSSVVFTFSTQGRWSAPDVAIVVRVGDEFGDDQGCLIAGGTYDDPDAYHCALLDAAGPKVAQTITFASAAPSPAYVGSSYTPDASATSGAAVAFSVTTPATCALAAGLVTFTDTGTCTVAADQAGNAAYLPALQATQSATVSKRPQVITFTPTPSTPAFVGTSTTASVVGGASGNAVSFSTLAPSVCTVTGSSVSYATIGTCVIAADQSGDAVYLAAAQTTATVSVIWPFTGFAKPINSPPALNAGRAGSKAVVKFSLGLNRGLSVLAGGSPTSAPISCTTSAVTGAQSPAPGTLTYDAKTAQYAYSWSTSRSYGNTCRRLDVVLADGTMHSALFSFK